MIDERREGRPTAYVLGEMTAEEKASFEAEMEGSEALRAEVEDIRQMASLLDHEMGQGRASLPPEVKDRIESAARAKAASEGRSQQKGPGAGRPNTNVRVSPPPPVVQGRSFGRTLAWIGAAGTFAAAAAMGMVFLQQRTSDSKLASQAAPTGYSSPPPYATMEPSPTGMGQPVSAVAALPGPAAANGRQESPVTATPGPFGDIPPAKAKEPSSNDRFDTIFENPFLKAQTDPLSTFSIDVDTASYALVRSHLQRGSLPPAGAVRIEEMINYFGYAYPEPDGDVPFHVQLDVGRAPWSSDHELVRVALKGKSAKLSMADGVNVVFLVDTSGSMNEPNKLPLLKQGFRMMVDKLKPEDHVAIVAYAGSAGLVLPSTPVRERATVLGALDRLSAGGSTNGGAGIDLAYKVASENFLRGGVNRVLLATDGDFNVGTTSQAALVDLIQAKAKTGVFLSVLGFGRGNFNDSLLEKIADKGNGQYAYIDSETEAKRTLVDGLGTLMTIAKDVKIQIEWNPAEVAAYRLIGYENRVMAARDFNDDKKDAGELGAGHTVTALYEVVPAGGSVPGGDGLKYQVPGATGGQAKPNAAPGELLTVKLRYKEPDGQTSKLLEKVLKDSDASFSSMSGDFKFAAAVASFGMLLRGSKNAGNATFASVLETAEANAGDDDRRREFVTLVRKAMTLAR